MTNSPPLQDGAMNQPSSLPATEAQQAAQELLHRRAIRRDLVLWAQECGFEPAAHHRLLIKYLMHAAEVGDQKIIVCMPPGSAKSTYIDLLFITWFLAQRPNKTVLACSYAKDLIASFGRRCRNLIKLKERVLGYSLSTDSHAADEWETTNGGRFFCAGVGAGIAGHRADFGLIDDPIGSEEDAGSQTFREKLWAWYENDFVPRLKPGASRFILANRRHEEDLVGMLLTKEPGEWTHIRIPRVAEENDPLGRAPGDRLWPEYFTQKMTDEAMRSPQASGLQQQDPHPVEGNFFKADNLLTYSSPLDVPRNINIYVASDYACSEAELKNNDKTCFIPFGVDSNKHIWILPDVWWEREDTGKAVAAMFRLAKYRKPIFWWAEKGQIEKSIGPFVKEKMVQEETYFTIIPLASTKNKLTRAQSIEPRTSAHTVHFPSFTSWWSKARHELLSFPNGKHDDFVDAFSKIGQGLQTLVAGKTDAPAPDYTDKNPQPLTMRWIKESAKRLERAREYANSDR